MPVAALMWNGLSSVSGGFLLRDLVWRVEVEEAVKAGRRPLEEAALEGRVSDREHHPVIQGASPAPAFGNRSAVWGAERYEIASI
jgi:hypothetical protein